MDRWGPKHVELTKSAEWNLLIKDHIVDLVGLHVYVDYIH